MQKYIAELGVGAANILTHISTDTLEDCVTETVLNFMIKYAQYIVNQCKWLMHNVQTH